MIACAVAALGLPTPNSWAVDTVVSHRKAALEKCDEAVARADGAAFRDSEADELRLVLPVAWSRFTVPPPRPPHAAPLGWAERLLPPARVR
jgi:hypothetical protein